MIGPCNTPPPTLDPKGFAADMYDRATRLGYHIDEFCGGGGASEGYRQATGREVSLVVNHKVEAVNMHRINHSAARHICQDVFAVDPIAALKMLGYTEEEIAAAARICGFLIRSGWFSPDCKHFSKAKGAALLDKRIRSLVWIMLKWCGRGGGGNFRRGPACPMVMFMENVEEFKTFGPLVADRCEVTGRVIKRDGTVAAPGEHVRYWDQKLVPCKKRMGLYFKRFIRWLQAFGAAVEWRELRACDYGAATLRNRPLPGGALRWPADRVSAANAW
jgi:DNA (cytosine-5)-methyltransferase 1